LHQKPTYIQLLWRSVRGMNRQQMSIIMLYIHTQKKRHYDNLS
jgi:hypothetical protein